MEGRADEKLLDSYAAEREPVAESLLHSIDRGFALIVSDRWISRMLRTRVIYQVVGLAMRFKRIRKRAFATISQIGIRYRGGPLSTDSSDAPRSGPRAGDRFPWMQIKFSLGAPASDVFARLDDTRFNLILVGQAPLADEPPELAGLLRTHVIPADVSNNRELQRVGIPSPSFYLLRPDGHIGLAGKYLSNGVLTQYLTERLGLRSAAQKPGMRLVC